MDDDRTQEALESLADLFLTGGISKPDDVKPARSSRSSVQNKDVDVNKNKNHVPDGPVPIRLAPKTPVQAYPFIIPQKQGGHTGVMDPEFDMNGDEIQDSREEQAALRRSRDQREAYLERIMASRFDEPATVSDQPRLRLHRPEPDDMDDELIGHHPDEQESGHVSTMTAHESDGLTGMGAESLPEDDVTDDQAFTGRAAVMAEAVIPGHLPATNGPWLTQYAQILADQYGPVGVIHLTGTHIDLELVRPIRRSSQPVAIELDGRDGLDLLMVLDALANSEDQPMKFVLLHVEDPISMENISQLAALDDWTVLCGADESAVISTYRQLKRFVRLDSGVRRKNVAVMVMGSSESQSQMAYTQIQSITNDFMLSPVQLAGWQKQIVPVNVVELGSFPDIQLQWPRLAQWLDQLEEPNFEPEEQTHPDPDIDSSGESAADMQDVPDRVESVIEDDAGDTDTDNDISTDIEAVAFEEEPDLPPSDSPAPVPDQEKESDSPRHRSAVSERPSERRSAGRHAADQQKVERSDRVVQSPKVTMPPREHISHGEQEEDLPHYGESSEPALQAESRSVDPSGRTLSPPREETPDLVDFLLAGPNAVPGGVPLDARCPYRRDARLLLDQDGVVHVLLRHQAEASSRNGLDSFRSAMLALIETRQWVESHMDLIRLTQRQCRINESQSPVLHLFTNRPDLAHAAAQHIGHLVKLHLLEELQVGDDSAWYCTALN